MSSDESDQEGGKPTEAGTTRAHVPLDETLARAAELARSSRRKGPGASEPPRARPSETKDKVVVRLMPQVEKFSERVAPSAPIKPPRPAPVRGGLPPRREAPPPTRAGDSPPPRRGAPPPTLAGDSPPSRKETPPRLDIWLQDEPPRPAVTPPPRKEAPAQGSASPEMPRHDPGSPQGPDPSPRETPRREMPKPRAPAPVTASTAGPMPSANEPSPSPVVRSLFGGRAEESAGEAPAVPKEAAGYARRSTEPPRYPGNIPLTASALALVVLVVFAWQLFEEPEPPSAAASAAAPLPGASASKPSQVTEPGALARSEAASPPPRPRRQLTATLQNAAARGERVITHTVAPGETLWEIADHYVKDPWAYRELAANSGIADPDLILPGDQVQIVFRGEP